MKKNRSRKLIEELIKSNLNDIKLRSHGIILKKSILNYFGEKETLDGVVSFFKKNESTNLRLPIEVHFMGEKVWDFHMTQEEAWWDCPNGTHFIYDGKDMMPVCEFRPNSNQKFKLKS